MSERNNITRLTPITTGVTYVESQDVPSYSSAQYSMPLVTVCCSIWGSE